MIYKVMSSLSRSLPDVLQRDETAEVPDLDILLRVQNPERRSLLHFSIPKWPAMPDNGVEFRTVRAKRPGIFGFACALHCTIVPSPQMISPPPSPVAHCLFGE
jgi:hypothetical protein